MASQVPLKLVTGGTPKVKEFSSSDTVPLANMDAAVLTTTGSQTPTNKDLRAVSNKIYQPLWAKREWEIMADPGATTFTSVGLKAAPTVSGSPAAGSSDSAGPFVRLSTSASANDVAGIVSASFDYTRRDWDPEFVWLVRTHTVITSIRILVGWADQNIDALAANPTTQHCAFVRYDTGLDTTGQFSTVTCDGGGTPTINTSASIPIAVSTPYLIRGVMDSNAGTVDFFFGDVLAFSHSTHLPGSTTSLGFFARVIDLTASARALQISRLAHRMK